MKACRILLCVLSVVLVWYSQDIHRSSMHFKAFIAKDKDIGYFTENIGQWNSEIQFMTHIGSKQIVFYDTGFSVYDTHSKSNTPYKLQSSSFQILGKELLPSSSSYFYGQDPGQWRSKARHYAKVLHQSKTDGTSIEYSINSQGLVCNDPTSKQQATVLIGFSEQNNPPPGSPSLDYESSNLFYSSYFGGSVLDETVKIQQGRDQSLYITGYTYSSDFPLHSSGNQTPWNGWCDIFLMKWNLNTRKLLFSVFIGGSMIDRPVDMTVNQDHEVYLTGYTYSNNFPTSKEAYQKQNRGKKDVFCMKLNERGTEILFSTLIGGTGDDHVSSIAIDDAKNILLCGFTKSEDFPASPGAHQRFLNGQSDVFFLKLNPRGSHVLYSTYIGGPSEDEAEALLIGNEGSVYIAGTTFSNNFLTHYRESTSGEALPGDVFLFEIRPNSHNVFLCDMFGGASLERVVAMSMDSKGVLWLGGNTFSSDFYSDIKKTSPDSKLPAIFLRSWDSIKKRAGTTYLFSGNQQDFLRSMFLWDDYSVYLAGLTFSNDLIPKTDFLAPFGNETGDGFLLRFNLLSSELEFATYWGGEGFDEITSIYPFGQEYVWIAGTTASTQFPITLSAFQKELTGHSNGFLSEILCVPKAQKPELILPENNKMDVSIAVDFFWSSSPHPARYKFFLFDSQSKLLFESKLIEENSYKLPMLLNPDTYYHWMVHLFNEANLMTASDLWRFKTEEENSSMAMHAETNKKKYKLNDQLYLKVCLQNIGNTPLGEVMLTIQHPEVFHINEILPSFDHQKEGTQLLIALPDFTYRGHLVLQINGSFLPEGSAESKISLLLKLYHKDQLLLEEELPVEIIP
jgi:hypothetical protein